MTALLVNTRTLLATNVVSTVRKVRSRTRWVPSRAATARLVLTPLSAHLLAFLVILVLMPRPPSLHPARLAPRVNTSPTPAKWLARTVLTVPTLMRKVISPARPALPVSIPTRPQAGSCVPLVLLVRTPAPPLPLVLSARPVLTPWPTALTLARTVALVNLPPLPAPPSASLA